MKTPPAVLLCCGVFSLTACGKRSAGPGAKERTTLHQDVAPHGGMPVAVGDDYKLELVRDGKTGTLSGYVLDDEMEEFIRSSSLSLTIHVKATGGPFTLVLNAVANPATGETLGDTSLFQGQADWLKSVDSFAGTVEGIAIRGPRFSGIKFNFPAGFRGSSNTHSGGDRRLPGTCGPTGRR